MLGQASFPPDGLVPELSAQNWSDVEIGIGGGVKIAEVILSLSKLDIKSKNLFYKSCSVWYTI